MVELIDDDDVEEVRLQLLDADEKRALAEPQADAVDGAIMMARRAQGLPERWS